MSTGRKIWIDLDNSPHVPFFFPIIQELRNQGHSVFLTARDCFQVCGLCKRYNLSFKRIGRHYGKNVLMKGFGTILRALQLAPVVIREKPDLSVSHGSRSLNVLSAIIRIPNVLIFDYEHTTKLPFIKSKLGIVPEYIDTSPLKGFFKNGMQKFPGLKEDVYVSGFKPDPSIFSELNINPDKVLVTIRPPATEAHYHNNDSQRLFVSVVNFLGARSDVNMVILPRNEVKQTEFIKKTWLDWYQSRRIVIPDRVVNGLNLIWHSDLVVSGGGTMNREAAALGVPVFSIFRSKQGAVDKYLVKNKRLTFIENPEDISEKIVPSKRKRPDRFQNQDTRLLSQVVNLILSAT